MRKVYILTFITTMLALLTAGKTSSGLYVSGLSGLLCTAAWIKLQYDLKFHRRMPNGTVRRTYGTRAAAGRARPR